MRHLELHAGLLLSATLSASLPSSAQPCPPIRVQVSPKVPVAGTLFRLAVPLPSTRIDLTGTLAGEPLRFRIAGDSLIAIAAAPIDSSNGLTLQWQCRSAGASSNASFNASFADSLRIATSAGNYRLERLKVAPRFTSAPDSALAARMANEASRAAAVSRAAHDTPRLYTTPFRAPRASRITSGFGSGRTFNDSVTSRHMGTDYAGATGAPVLAANRGVVRLVDRFYLGGNVVYIDHGNGLITAYLHLSKTRVAVGDTVSRGQRIGDVGATGRVTGPHLHFIARYGQITVNPISVIDKTP
ncbi:MAG: M23 family metallopeptidase [Gemmatimonadaceae bacterium]|nr:M23 family metallopeptidase [Gemmatimonadaceae bacterium]